ncbi:MAG: DHHA1 domain-containing protein [Candidatus Poseidoniaceae archaeon]|nr:DHHA1 domain-containing protein [Candidatus Poseidoniaceae archaeon]
MSSLKKWIDDATSRGAVPVLAGKNGDMDTIGSAIALAASNPTLMACGRHMGRMAAKLCDELSAPFKKLSEKPMWPNKLGGIIIVDSASENQTGVKLPENVPICVIDHHDTCDWSFSELDLEYRMNTRSTTQIIFEYLESHHPESLTEEVRKLLLAGLISDTGRFRHADSSALTCATKILDGADFEYQEFIEKIQDQSITSSDRGAIIKALSRCSNLDAGAWNLVTTKAGIMEGRVASILIQAGAEIALVSRFRDGETRLTSRAPRSITKEGIHLGEIMQKISNKLGGDGGGHDGAAGWSGKSDVISAETAFINELASIRRNNN